jgi:hypothetical protein
MLYGFGFGWIWQSGGVDSRIPSPYNHQQHHHLQNKNCPSQDLDIQPEIMVLHFQWQVMLQWQPF